MNLIYGALLLHSAGKQVTEENIKKVADAIGGAEDVQVKSLVAALEGVNIGDVISKAAMPVAVATATAAAQPSAEAKKEEVSEEQQEKKAEDAAAGLSALFG